jgi:ABC-type multidrug transport system fused ATPase/permease subunit
MRKTPLFRLAGRLRPERSKAVLAAVLGLGGVWCIVTVPFIIGDATNILFDGFIGKSLAAGQTKAQAVAALRAHGEGVYARMVAGMHVAPGTGVDLAKFGQVLGIAAGMYLLASAFVWGQGFVMAGIAQRTVYRLRQDAEEKLARLPLRYFDTRSHGDILSRVTNDIDNLATTLQEGLSQLINAVLTVLGVLAMMFLISPLLAAVSATVIPLTIAATMVIARRARPQFVAQWMMTGELNALIEETHTGHALVRAFGQRQPMADEFGRKNEALYGVSRRGQFLAGAVQPAVQFLGNLSYVVIAVLGGYLVTTGALSLGSVQAFILYARLFTLPVSQMANQMGLLQSGLASAQRVFDLLDADEEVDIQAREAATGAGETRAAARRVELRHVSFRYHPDTPLIEDFTLNVAPGQTVAIVGPTGAGKTTIVNLLMRFYETQAGRILLDGVDYRDLSRDEVRRCFGLVLQDTWLFAGTVRDNIGYGKDGASDDEIVAAARAAYADQFIRTLPEGYATILNGESSGISAGQRQLLTIARVFLADPGILILDEATSNVDARTEILVQQAMSRLRAGRTSFVIAHRLSTIRNADTIVVMDAGRIVEQGSHRVLLASRGFYHSLFSSQFTRALTP